MLYESYRRKDSRRVRDALWGQKLFSWNLNANVVKMGGEKLTIKLKTLQIEKLPETNDVETWSKFNDRLNELANQGYTVLRVTETYILLSRKTNATRREE